MRVYERAIDMNRQLARVADTIGRHDRDLLSQMRRAAASVALNIAEALGQKGGNRELRFAAALGSAREVRACLDVAAAWGCAAALDEELIRAVDHAIGSLVNLVRAR
jgi:four helix bundle protein